MRINSIYIQNVLAVKESFISFPESGLMLVDGWNYDDDTANGSGKTSIFNAVSLALYGKIPRKITNTKIARKGSKGFYVKCCVSVGQSSIEIERHKPRDFSVTVDGNSQTWTQEQLDSFLGLNYEQFLLTVYKSQSESLNFVHLNDQDKKDLFLKLIDLNRFDDMKSGIDAAIKEKSNSLVELDKKLNAASTKIDVYSESLQDIEPMKLELSKIDTSHIVKELDILTSSFSSVGDPEGGKKIASLNSQIKKLYELQSDEKVDRANLASLNNTLKNIDVSVNSKLTHVDCPHCSKGFSLTSNKSLRQDQVDKIIEKKKSEIQEQIDAVVIKINSYPIFDAEISRLNQQINITQQEINARAEIRSNNQIRQFELNQLLKDLEMRKDYLKSAIESDLENREKISKLKRLKKDLHNKIESLKTEVQYLEAVSAIVAPTGAPAYVLDSIVELFNQMVSDVLLEIWPNAQYVLLTYKESKSGDSKSKMSERLTVNGIEVDVGSLSGGELACLSLAINLGLILTLESATGNSIDTIVLDEQFENMDYANRERCLNVLQKYSLDRSIIIIDHSSEAKSSFSKILRVEKRNSISSVIQ